MADTPQKVAQATAKAIGEQEKKPPPLTKGEKALAGFLLFAGLIVIGVTLFAFSTADSDFTFKQKEKTITEPATVAAVVKSSAKVNCGAKPTRKARKRCRKKQRQLAKRNAAGKGKPSSGGAAAAKASPRKVTTEVEYSDSVAIAALGVGAAMAIGGGFYGRIRSLKFPGGEASFGAAPDPGTKAALEQKTEEKVEEAGITDPEKKAAITVGAEKVGIAQVRTVVASGVEPNEMILEGIADQAVNEMAAAIDPE